MAEIKTYSISKIQRELEIHSGAKDYFLVDRGKGPIYTDEPFRTETYAFLLLKKGEIHINTGLISHVVKAPAMITAAPGIPRRFSPTEETPEIELLFFTESFLSESQPDVFFLTNFSFFEDPDKLVISLQDEEIARVQSIFAELKNYHIDNSIHERAIVRHLIHILIYNADLFQKKHVFPETDSYPKNQLFQKFRILLRKDFRSARSLKYYANALNVTPKHLSEVVKQNSGKTAREWIDKVVLLEAKLLLRDNSLDISQISEYLNFIDQSTFGKYFKNLQGISPSQYRKTSL